jgi:hypothetical protein
MNDAELDEFERAMNAWEVDHTPARIPAVAASKLVASSSHHRRSTTPPPPLVKTNDGSVETSEAPHEADEFAGYVKRQQARERSRSHQPDATQSASPGAAHAKATHSRPRRQQQQHPPPKTYGYQEPTLFERRRPQPRLPPLEERHRVGGWNHSTLLVEEDPTKPAGRRSVPLLSSRPPASGHPLTRQPRSAGAAPTGLDAVKNHGGKKPPFHLTPVGERSAVNSGTDAGVSGPTRNTTSAQSILDNTSGSHRASLHLGNISVEDNVIVVVPHPVATSIQNSITAAMQELSDRRAEKAILQRRMQTTEEDRARKLAEIQSRKTELAQLEKRANRAKDVKKELGQLVAVQRTKEHQLAETRNILRQCLKRLHDAKLLVNASVDNTREAPVVNKREASSSAGVHVPKLAITPTDNDHDEDVGEIVVNPSRAIAALKVKWGKLTAEQTTLTTEKTRLSAKVNKGAEKQHAELAKLSKQRIAITKELERRAKAEYEASRQHIKQNHEKGMLHRAREQSHTMEAEQARQRDLSIRVKDVHEQLKTQSKSIHELSSRESALRIQARDAEQRCADAENAISMERKALQETIEAKEALLKKLDGIAYERQLLTEKLSDPKKIAEVQRAHEDERKAMMSAVTDAQQAQLGLVQRVAQLERQLADGSLLVRHRFVNDPTKPLNKSIPELRLRIQQYREELVRLSQLTEDTRTETETRKRDAAKNRKLKDMQEDRAIEQLTKELATCKETSKACTKDNHQLESVLDTAERMISMNNLRHT